MEAENKYDSLLSEGGWTAGGAKGNDQDSMFFLGNSHNCGQKGHMAKKDCRLPKNNNDGGGCGGDCSGHGRGCGGRGRRRGGGRCGTVGPPHRLVARRNLQNPVTQSRDKDGKVELWCGCCALWTEHNTKRHQEMAFAANGGTTPNSGSGSTGGDSNNSSNASAANQRLALWF